MKRAANEDEEVFLKRARDAVIDLAHDDETLESNRRAMPGGGMSEPEAASKDGA
jgi:hypothetical protein